MALNRVKQFLASRVMDKVINVIVALTLVASGFLWSQNRALTHQVVEQAERTEELARCIAAYNNAMNARSDALGKAADDERRAERKADDAQAAMFLSPALTKPADKITPADRTEFIRRFREFQNALAEQKRERTAADDARRNHPIPDPPSEVCG